MTVDTGLILKLRHLDDGVTQGRFVLIDCGDAVGFCIPDNGGVLAHRFTYILRVGSDGFFCAKIFGCGF